MDVEQTVGKRGPLHHPTGTPPRWKGQKEENVEQKTGEVPSLSPPTDSTSPPPGTPGRNMPLSFSRSILVLLPLLLFLVKAVILTSGHATTFYTVYCQGLKFRFAFFSVCKPELSSAGVSVGCVFHFEKFVFLFETCRSRRDVLNYVVFNSESYLLKQKYVSKSSDISCIIR